MNEREQHGYFVGRISPFLLFEFEYHSLDEVVSTFDGKQRFNKSNPAAEVCLIGLVAHFEAFCKHLFAASANLNVSALRRFRRTAGPNSRFGCRTCSRLGSHRTTATVSS